MSELQILVILLLFSIGGLLILFRRLAYLKSNDALPNLTKEERQMGVWFIYLSIAGAVFMLLFCIYNLLVV